MAMKHSPKRGKRLNLGSTMSQPVFSYAGCFGLNHDTQPHGSTSEKAVIFSSQSATYIFLTAQPSTQPVEDAVIGRGG
jgi:hypothetical protein